MNESNLNSFLVALDRHCDMFELNRLHREVQFLAQVMHESGDIRYDLEVWGPTRSASISSSTPISIQR